VAANIEHVYPHLVLIHVMDVKNIAPDLLTGFKLPGDPDIVNLRRSGRQ
jgi:hypothetical protein